MFHLQELLISIVLLSASYLNVTCTVPSLHCSMMVCQYLYSFRMSEVCVCVCVNMSVHTEQSTVSPPSLQWYKTCIKHPVCPFI
jgi:hypothetical protein